MLWNYNFLLLLLLSAKVIKIICACRSKRSDHKKCQYGIDYCCPLCLAVWCKHQNTIKIKERKKKKKKWEWTVNQTACWERKRNNNYLKQKKRKKFLFFFSINFISFVQRTHENFITANLKKWNDEQGISSVCVLF